MSVCLRLLIVIACAVVVAGCGGSFRSSPAVLPPQTHHVPQRGWISAEAKSAKQLLYVADPTSLPSYYGAIDIFALHGLK
jgi:hypothetical protein